MTENLPNMSNDGHGRVGSPASQFINRSSEGGGHGLYCLYSTASQLHLNGCEKQLCERMRQFIKHLSGKVMGTASSSSGTTNCRREEAGEWTLSSARHSRSMALTQCSSRMWTSWAETDSTKETPGSARNRRSASETASWLKLEPRGMGFRDDCSESIAASVSMASLRPSSDTTSRSTTM